MDHNLIEKYTKTHGCRFTRAQKKKFLKELDSDMQAAGYGAAQIRGKHFISRAENYLYGNIKQIKTLIVVPYDTPERKFWPKVTYYPMDGTKTANKSMLPTYVPILILFAIVFFGVYVIQPKLTSTTSAAIMSAVMFALTLSLVYLMLHGVHNRNNYNRNSIAIAQAVEIARRMDKEERQKTGFLFTDKNKMRFLGAESSVKYLNEHGKNPNIICLDCIANGSVTKIGYNPQNRKMAAEIAKLYPMKKTNIECVKLNDSMRMQSAMSYFKKAVLISSGETDADGNLYVMDTGTGKDTQIESDLADKIGDMIYRYIHTQK